MKKPQSDFSRHVDTFIAAAFGAMFVGMLYLLPDAWMESLADFMLKAPVAILIYGLPLALFLRLILWLFRKG